MRPDAEVNAIDSHGEYAGYTALIYASHFGLLDAVSALLSKPETDVNVEGDDDGYTALMLAAVRGHDAIVNLLLQRPELEVNKATKDTLETALMFASKKGHHAVVHILLKHPNIDLNLKDWRGVSAIHKAAGNGNPTAIQELLKRSELDVTQVEEVFLI